VAGTVAKILAEEGQIIAVHTLVAQIEASGDVAGAARTLAAPEPPETKSRDADLPSAAQGTATPPPHRASQPAAARAGKTPDESMEEDGKVRSSPLVRRLAREHNVNLSDVEGSGPGGRITKEDLLSYAERREAAPAETSPPRLTSVPAVETSQGMPATRTEIVPMTPMRKKIAERMVLSRHTAAHVTSVFRVDLTKVVSIYNRERNRFEQQENVKLSFTPFFVRAVIDGLKRFPVVNSSVSGDDIIYKKDIHMGIAVALDWGLIVPVIAHADEKSFLGLTRAVNDLAERARQKRLKVSEVEGGTFTITNPGALGGLFATPIINPPQVGIVGVGGIHKEPVVINDAIAIRSIVHLSLSYDHRVVDGAVADQFLASVKTFLEDWEEDLFA
jgi:2-oxoglutarate dehydrogenase E2 component (dihydrolipoamide succinyltransferase)